MIISGGTALVEGIGFMTKRGASPYESTRGKVERWLAGMDFNVKQESFPNMAWVLIAQKGNGIGFAVGQQFGKQDSIVVQSALLIEPEYKQQLAMLSNEARAQFIWDVRFLLLTLPAPFENVQEPLEMVNFVDVIFIEALSRTSLSEAIFKINKSYLALSWMLQQKFSDIKPHGGFSFHMGGIVQ